MPGTRLPEWFSGQSVSFSKRQNLDLTSVIVGVIFSINHNIKRNQVPWVVDIQANVLKLGKPVFNSTLSIGGVPKTNEDHIHIIRFKDYHPLVAFLRDADTVSVTKRSPPFDEGLELKNCGVHLIFEGDDDYEGNEESLDKGLQSVSEKLARFFNTCEGLDANCATENGDYCEQKLKQQKEEPRSYHVTLHSILLFLISLFFVLLSWFSLRYMSYA